MRTRVIGLGNTILSDDGVGIYAAREIRRRLAAAGRTENADVVETEVGGFALMELMAGWDRVILLDAVLFDGVAPGTVVTIDPQDLRTSLRIRSVHDIDLPTVLGLGRALGFAMPAEILIYGIQAGDACTLGEQLTPEVAEAMNRVVEKVLAALEEACGREPGPGCPHPADDSPAAAGCRSGSMCPEKPPAGTPEMRLPPGAPAGGHPHGDRAARLFAPS